MTKIGVYIGTEADGTKQIFAKQPWEIFFGTHSVEVFGSAPLPERVQDSYAQYYTTPRLADNPLSKIVNGYRDCQEYLDHRSPDVLVQLMRTPTHAPSVIIAGSTADIPTVTRVTGDLFHQYQGYHTLMEKLGSFVLNYGAGHLIARCSSKTIVLGPHGKAQLLARGAESKGLHIIPPLLRDQFQLQPTEDQEKYRECLDIPVNQTVAFYAGRLISQKGMEFLSEVISRTNRRGNVLFILGGSGPYRDQFRQRFDRDLVRPVGEIPYNRMHKYYKSADVYVHPSPHEGIPLSILEALNCETPVVARDAGDISFVTPNIVTSPKQMAATILEENYDATWLNEHQFETETIRRNVQSLLDEII